MQVGFSRFLLASWDQTLHLSLFTLYSGTNLILARHRVLINILSTGGLFKDVEVDVIGLLVNEQTGGDN